MNPLLQHPARASAFRPLALAAAIFALLSAVLQAGPPPEKTQQLTSRDQVPEGLAKSDWQSIRAAYEAGRHAFQPTATGWQARNPGQQWTTKFDGRGFIVEPRDGAWQWGLELESYGFGDKQKVIGGMPAAKAAGTRLSYQWDATMQEWFVNDQRGLEHGFTVQERPSETLNSQPATLNFLLATRGTLRPAITVDAQGVEFRDAGGATVLHYAGLRVWDADGKVLLSRFEAAGEERVRLLVEERGARYPLTIDPIAQQAYLKPAAVGSTQAQDRFGSSVAVSGDTVVVGAPFEDSSTTGVNSTPNESALDSGAAYVFVRSAGVWTQQAYLKPAAVGATQAGDQFGWSVAISGDTVVVGAPVEDSSTTGVDSTPNETAADSGAAYVFVRSAGVWTQEAYLKLAAVGTTQVGDNFGISVAVSGDTVAVGAWQEDGGTTGVNSTPNESASDSGAAYVFVRNIVCGAGVWTQQAYLKPAVVGTTQAGDRFGWSVAVSGDSVVAGAYLEDSSTTGVNSTPNESAANSGAAYVFARSAGVWTQQAYLKPATVGTTQAQDQFGFSVAASDDTVVVGARLEDSSTTGVNSTPNESAAASGAAYVFARSAGVWTQQAYLKPATVGTTQMNDFFGSSLAVSGDTVVVGAPLEDSSTTGVNSTPNESVLDSGAAYVFTRSAGGWTQQAYLKPDAIGTTQMTDNFGTSVAVSVDTVVVGAYQEDSSTTGVNSTPSESALDSGAAYTFAGLGLPEITVQQPAGMGLTSGVSSIGYGGVAWGSSSGAKTFTIVNANTGTLTIASVSATGGNEGDFAVDTTGMLTSVPAGGSTTFSVTFTPAAVGSRTTTLRILNDDGDEATFDITLTGTSLSFTTDTDGDGLNDASEFQLAGLGFDWEASQPALVGALPGILNSAGFYTPAQVQALNVGVPLIQRSPAGVFTLTLGVEKSTDLSTFIPFPMNSPGFTTVINGAGELEFQFTVPDNAAFFRLEAR